MGKAEYIRTLLLPREGGKVILKRPSTQVHQIKIAVNEDPEIY